MKQAVHLGTAYGMLTQMLFLHLTLLRAILWKNCMLMVFKRYIPQTISKISNLSFLFDIAQQIVNTCITLLLQTLFHQVATSGQSRTQAESSLSRHGG